MRRTRATAINITPIGYQRNDFDKDPPAARETKVIPCAIVIKARITPIISRYLNQDGSDTSVDSSAKTGLIAKKASKKNKEIKTNNFLFYKFVIGYILVIFINQDIYSAFVLARGFFV